MVSKNVGLFSPASPVAGTPGAGLSLNAQLLLSPSGGTLEDRIAPAEGGVLGLFSNAFRDVQDIVGGIAAIGGAVVTDLVKAPFDLVPGVSFDYKTDDIVNAVTGGMLNMFGEGWHPSESVLVADYADRYGELFAGDIAGFAGEMYRSPLSFIADALMVASMGGTAAAVAAKSLSAGAKVGEVAAKLGATTVRAELSMVKSGILTMDDVGRAAQFVDMVSGSAIQYIDPISKKLAFFDPMRNPVKRRLFQEPAIRLLMERGGASAKLAERLSMEALNSGAPALELANHAFQVQELFKLAEAGTPIMRRWASTYKARRFVDFMVGSSKMQKAAVMREVNGAVNETLKDLSDAVTEVDVANAALNLDGSLVNDGYTPPTGRSQAHVERFDPVGPQSTDLGFDPGAGNVQSETAGITSRLTNAQEADVQTAFAAQLEGLTAPETGAPIVDHAAWVAEDAATLRQAFGPGVVKAGPLKTPDSAARKMALGGVVDDGGARFRIVRADLNTHKGLMEAFETARTALGGRIRRIENTVSTPDADGSRMLRVVLDTDKGPVELHFVTPLANRALDATGNLRKHLDGLAIAAKSATGQDLLDIARQMKVAEAYSQNLWTAVTSEMRVALGGHVYTPLRNKLDLLRLELHRIMGDPAIEAGLPVQSLFENPYLAQRMMNGAHFSDEVGDFIGGGEGVLSLNNRTTQAGDMVPVYMPMIDARRLPMRGEFLLRRSGGSELRLLEDANLRKNTGYLLEKSIERTTDEVALRPQPGWYRFQDAALEAIPKQVTNRKVGTALEMAMDIGREVALKGADAKNLGYVAEKVRRLRALFDESGGMKSWRVSDVDRAQLNDLGNELVIYNGPSNAVLDEVSNLTRAIASGNPELARNILKQVEDAVAKATEEVTTGRLKTKGGLISTDLRKVYAVRARRAANAQVSYEMVRSTLDQYSRPVVDWTQKADDEVMWSPTLLGFLGNTRRGSDDVLMRALEQGLDEGEELASWLERTTIRNQEHMAQLLATQDLELRAVPRVVAARLDSYIKQSFGETVQVLWGAPTQMWKTLVLAGSPRWVMNNVVGNTIFLKLQGGRMSDVLRQLDGRWVKKLRRAVGMQEDNQFKLALREVMSPSTQRKVEAGGLYDVESHGHIRQYTDDTLAGRVASRMQQSSKVNAPLSKPRQFSDWVHRVNEGVEEAYRHASYMTAADRTAIRAGVLSNAHKFWTSKENLAAAFRTGMDEGAAGKLVDEVNHYLNDYNRMTPAGQNIIRPYLVPFWGFYRHATKMLLTMPFEHPGKAMLLRLFNDAAETERDKLGLMPSWLQNSLPLGPGAVAGEYRFLSTAGMNPFNTVLESPLNIMHPYAKLMYEQSTGRSTFTGKQFTDPSVYKAFGSEQQYRVGADGVPIPIEKVTPGILQHVLSQIPQYNLVSDLLAGGATYDTADLIDILRGQGTIIDEETGQPLYDKGMLLTIAKMLGYSESTFNPSAFTERRLAEIEAVLKQAEERTLAA